MISEITIKGFQSHVNSTFRLSPGLTVVTGPTDSGKTAIIRAIRWVAFNEPAGDGFVNESVGEALVTITLANGTVITKGRRKGGRTSYQLTLAEGKPQLFEQADVPPEVMAALGITRQKFGDFETALNFAFQLEAPFLISEPPSAGAKVLGVIAGTEIVDLAIKATSKDTHAARAKRLKADQDVQQYEKDLKQYDDLDALIDQGQACETLMQKFDALVTRTATLRVLDLQAYVADAKISDLEQRIADLNLDVVTPLVEWLPGQYDRYSRLTVAKEQYSSHGLVIRACHARLEQLSGIPKAADLLSAVEQHMSRKNTLLDLASRFVTVSQVFQAAELTLEHTQHLETAEADVMSIERSFSRKNVLTELASRSREVTRQILQIDQVLQASKDIDLAAAKAADLAAGVNRLEALKQLRVQHQANSLYWRARETIVEATAGIAQAATMLASVAETRDKLQRLQEILTVFRIKNDTLQQAASRASAAEQAVSAQEQLLQGLWAELNVCPLCEQPIMKGDMIHGH